jgi:hypothetical protein
MLIVSLCQLLTAGRHVRILSQFYTIYLETCRLECRKLILHITVSLTVRLSLAPIARRIPVAR